MFCPKCGSQNSDETRYCRGCGADLSGVLSAIEGIAPNVSPLTEKHIAIFSSGLRGLMLGIGFLIVAAVAFGISMKLSVLGVFALAFGFFFLSAGIARLVQAKALKRLSEPKIDKVLTSGETEYFNPARSIYKTDDLLTTTPRSITEHTTTHLDKKTVNDER